MPEFETTERVVRKVKARPCIKCGGTALEFWWDKELMQDAVSCANKQCEHTVRGPEQRDNGAAVLYLWNPANDPNKALADAENRLGILQREITRLKRLIRINRTEDLS